MIMHTEPMISFCTMHVFTIATAASSACAHVWAPGLSQLALAELALLACGCHLDWTT